MDFFSILTLVGGLAMFLYGMQVMGDGLEKLSGGKLEKILENLSSNRVKAVLVGAAVTAIIQSSSATTVMVVGFVNSGIMHLSQAVGFIMGANIGTTVTAWILSLAGIESSNFFVRLLNHSGWFRSADVRYEYHERCRKTSGRGTGIYKHPSEVLQPCFRCAGRCTSDCCYSVFISFCWYSPGALCNWCSPLRSSASDYHGTEYWNLYYSNAFFNRCY